MLAFCPRAQLLYYFSPISTQILCLQEYIQESIFSRNYINCPRLSSTTRVLLPDQEEGRKIAVETSQEESGEKEEQDEYNEGKQLNCNNNLVKTKKEGKERKYNKAAKKRKTRGTNQSTLT